jgi:hypothetical protein
VTTRARAPASASIGLLVLAPLLFAALVAACGAAAPTPLPAGPPPEYEAPRSYQPAAGNIDSAATGAVPEAPATGSAKQAPVLAGAATGATGP